MTRAPRAPRLVALSLALTFALPAVMLTAGCGKSNDQATTSSAPGPMANDTRMANNAPAKAGMTTKQKVVLLGGAALLFYLYKRYQKQDQAAAAQNGAMGANGKPQLYREEKGPNAGAIYYRKNDANHTVVWLSAPQQPVQVQQSDVQQYLPDYNPNNPNGGNYGNINVNPRAGVNGGSVQSADQYANAGGGYGGGYPSGPGGPPGPRR